MLYSVMSLSNKDALKQNTELNMANKANDNAYTADDIEVLEGLEPVRKRPGMYIGGTDINAMHHLIAEIFDNSMDEAIAGHADLIKVTLETNNRIAISDNGRGIPIDKHPKFPDKTALEVVLTTLHSGGKFSNKAYATSGGLHGVGLSVVNALSKELDVEVTQNKQRLLQNYVRGFKQGETSTEMKNSVHGTKISFVPDDEIFGDIKFSPEKAYQFITSRAYLNKGITIDWRCAPSLCSEKVPAQKTIHYANGLKDFLNDLTGEYLLIPDSIIHNESDLEHKEKVEIALCFIDEGEPFLISYCNTIKTALGGSHEQAFKSALLKSLKSYIQISNTKSMANFVIDDVLDCLGAVISLFIREPIFQGQTKDKLLNENIAKQVEGSIKTTIESWLISNSSIANQILNKINEVANDRLSRKKDKEVSRKSPIRALRLPGKLTDCERESNVGTELFLVEGDSAGGSAKQARNRDNQAILPLKGKILNVASNSIDKVVANKELEDLVTALGCGLNKTYNHSKLRYDKVIIMTDADVDGAHITSLLLTFFYLQMPQLISGGHLYLAQPPLYKLVYKNKNFYLKNDAEKEKFLKQNGNPSNVEMSRFKGLGEMTAPQLKETTMNPNTRTLLKVKVDDTLESYKQSLINLMGRDPQHRYNFIQEKSGLLQDTLNKLIDV